MQLLLQRFDLLQAFPRNVVEGDLDAVDRGRGLDDVLPGVTLREIGRVLGVPNSQQNGEFLGDVDFVWCPEGLREADARLLGDVRGKKVLELGAGAAAGARWLAGQGAEVVALDLSAGGCVAR